MKFNAISEETCNFLDRCATALFLPLYKTRVKIKSSPSFSIQLNKNVIYSLHDDSQGQLGKRWKRGQGRPRSILKSTKFCLNVIVEIRRNRIVFKIAFTNILVYIYIVFRERLPESSIWLQIHFNLLRFGIIEYIIATQITS